MLPSTGSAGDCFDNAMAKSFFAPWSASSSTGAPFRPRPRRAWRSSNSSKAGTTHAVVIRPWVTSAPTTSNAPRRRKRHVQCATLIVRLEPSPVLPGAASQRSRHTPRGHPIYRIGRRLYVHRLSPTSGRGTTALNCPLKRGKSNALQGHLAEFEVIAPQGPAYLGQLALAVADPGSGLPEAVQELGGVLLDQIAGLNELFAGWFWPVPTRGRPDARRLAQVRIALAPTLTCPLQTGPVYQ